MVQLEGFGDDEDELAAARVKVSDTEKALAAAQQEAAVPDEPPGENNTTEGGSRSEAFKELDQFRSREKKADEAAAKAGKELEAIEAAHVEVVQRYTAEKIQAEAKLDATKKRHEDAMAEVAAAGRKTMRFGVAGAEEVEVIAADDEEEGKSQQQQMQEMQQERQQMQQQQQVFFAQQTQWQQQLQAEAAAAVAAHKAEMQNVVLTERARIKAIQDEIVEVSRIQPQTPETLARQVQLRASIDCQYQAAEPEPSPASPPPPTIPEVTLPAAAGKGGRRGGGAAGAPVRVHQAGFDKKAAAEAKRAAEAKAKELKQLKGGAGDVD